MKYVSTLQGALLALGLACSDEPAAESPTAPSWRACGSGTQSPTASFPGALTAPPETGTLAPGARPLDLLFVIDNSRSMAEKQQLLRQVANVLERFARPACIDAAGNQFPSPSPGATCAEGQRLQFEPVADMHLGVITTSLGDGGANVACPADPGFPQFLADRVDMAHLLGTLPRAAAGGTGSEGFVRWRAGEDIATATTSFGNLLATAGELGCGWEMPLEAWYRFLVDPMPYASLTRVQCPGSSSTGLNCVARATCDDGGVLLDEPLLAQRAAFLRPDSRLGIVMLSDENDCSMVIGEQYWPVLAIDDPRPFFRGSSACDSDPNDPCCYSCPLGAPDGCTDDPACAAGGASGSLPYRLPPEADGQGLRCFQQKRRFGVDFLYPVARYVNALTLPMLCPFADDLAVAGCSGPLEPNPLYVGGRAPSDVFLAGILGVPWQLLEAPTNVPEASASENAFRFKLANELTDADWLAMVGDPSASPPLEPTSPFMVESPLPRPGVTSPNAVNGREYETRYFGTSASGIADDLEYACIIPLPEARDCATFDPGATSCDCYEGARDRPLCEEQPGVSAAGPVQYWGKAYPSTRQLQVLRGVGERAIVASICARNTVDATASDFAYRRALAAVVDGMEAALVQP
jgi:hypothetical protein